MVAHPDQLRIVSTFSGVGGLDAGLGLALDELGVPHRHVLYVEREVASARVLAARMADGSLDPAPIWSDVRSIPDIGGADLLCGGFPCQDISTAGKGAGIHGERSGLFFDMLDAAVRLGCRHLFLENVAAITTRGLDTVLGSLAEAGFDAEWCHLSLAALGFPQNRERWFCLAYARGERSQGVVSGGAAPGTTGRGRGAEVRHTFDCEPCDCCGEPWCDECGAHHADCSCPGPHGDPMGDTIDWQRGQGPGLDAGDGGSFGLETRQSDGADGAVHLPLSPPGPSDADAWGWVLERWPWLAPAVGHSAKHHGRPGERDSEAGVGADCERRGRPSGAGTRQYVEAPQPPVRGVAPGDAGGVDIDRADRLRALGNLATTAQSLVAFHELWLRAYGD